MQHLSGRIRSYVDLYHLPHVNGWKSQGLHYVGHCFVMSVCMYYTDSARHTITAGQGLDCLGVDCDRRNSYLVEFDNLRQVVSFGTQARVPLRLPSLHTPRIKYKMRHTTTRGSDSRIPALFDNVRKPPRSLRTVHSNGSLEHTWGPFQLCNSQHARLVAVRQLAS